MKHSFIETIKQSSHFVTNSDRSNSVTTNKKSVTPTLMLLKNGWTIPKWKKFHYSEKQKSTLLRYFEEGEQNGMKRTPEQVISTKISSEKIKIKLIQ